VSTSNPNVTSTILKALRKDPDMRVAILFGSLASGTERFESDVDLALDRGRPITASEKMTLIREIAEETGRPVDLIDLQTVGEPLLGQILKHGIRILGTNTNYAAIIRKHLFDSADFLPYRNRILQARRNAWIAK
jgi:predicted nucleotidyltransferase